MSPDAGQAWFRLGTFLVLMSLVSFFFTPRDSAEFVISALSLVIGLLMLGMVTLIIKLSNR
jgi:hypothetical protein